MENNLSNRANAFIKELEETGRRFKRVPQEVKLFISGAKPSLVITTSHSYANLLMKHYPSITKPLHGSCSINVFNDYSKMYDYMNKLQLIDSKRAGEPYVLHSFKDLGIALGYPPSACEWFGEHLSKCELPSKKLKNVCFVYYHGMQFVTTTELIEENIEWLYENIKVPEEFTYASYVEYPVSVSKDGTVNRDVIQFEDIKIVVNC